MIEKCAGVVTDWLISCEVVEETDKELYSYAVYSILLTFSPLMLAIGFGICFGYVKQSVMMVLPFVIIRKFSGGYHIKNAWSCQLGSCLLLILCMMVALHIKYGWLLTFITVGASVSLICFSPIENENRELSQEEHRCYKKVTAVIVAFFLLMDGLFYWCNLYTYSNFVAVGIVLSAGLQIPCIFKKTNSVEKMTR